MKQVCSENDVQAAIVEYLRTIRRKTVKQTNLATKKIIADPGVPDLIITDDWYPVGCWLGLELKRPEVKYGNKVVQKRGTPSAEQKALESRGRIVIVDSIEGAAVALDLFEAAMARIGAAQ